MSNTGFVLLWFYFTLFLKEEKYLQKKKKMKKLSRKEVRKAGALLLAVSAAFSGLPQVSFSQAAGVSDSVISNVSESVNAAMGYDLQGVIKSTSGKMKAVSENYAENKGAYSTGVFSKSRKFSRTVSESSVSTKGSSGKVPDDSEYSENKTTGEKNYSQSEKGTSKELNDKKEKENGNADNSDNKEENSLINNDVRNSLPRRSGVMLKAAAAKDSFSIDGITGGEHVITMKKNNTTDIPIFCLSPGKRARTGWSLHKVDSRSEDGISVDSDKIKDYIKGSNLGKKEVIAILGRAVSDGKIDEDDDYILLRDTLRDIWNSGVTKFAYLNSRHENIMIRALDPYVSFTESREVKKIPAKPEISTTKNTGHYSFYPAGQTWMYNNKADQPFRIKSALKFSPGRNSNPGPVGDYSGYMHFSFSGNVDNGTDAASQIKGNNFSLGNRVKGKKKNNSNVYVVMEQAFEKVVTQAAEPEKTIETNTGNFSGRSVGNYTGRGNDAYKIKSVTAVQKGWFNIFEHDSTGTSQVFVRIGAKSKPVDRIPFRYCGYARQKILVKKNIAGASYNITAHDIWNSDEDEGAELINLRYEDAEGAAHEANEDIADLSKVSIKGKNLTVKDLKTDPSGNISLSLTWKYSTRKTYKSNLIESEINKKKKAAKNDVAKWMKNMKVTYTVNETDSGNPDYAIISADQNFILGRENTYFKKNPDSADSWNDNEPEKINGSDSSDSEKIAKHLYTLKNDDQPKYKSLIIEKERDTGSKATDNTPSLAGAEFGLYSDEACTGLVEKKATSGNSDYASLSFDAKIYSGKTYYVKELKAPAGYKLNPEVKKVSWKDTGTASSQVDFGQQSETVKETLKTGKFNIIKTMTSDDERPEKGAVFIVKNSRGEAMGAPLVTDAEGVTPFTEDLTEGVYSIEQVKTGNSDSDDTSLKEKRYVRLYDNGTGEDLLALKCSSDGKAVYASGYHGESSPVAVAEKEYLNNSLTTYSFNNQDTDEEKVYGLKLTKKDSTYNTVSRREGHMFRIYRIDTYDSENPSEYPETFTFEKAGGRKVTHRIKPVKNDAGTYLFSTDSTGTIFFSTSEAAGIRQGRYLIREVKPADGYYITTEYIEVNLRGFKTDDYDAVIYEASGQKAREGNLHEEEVRKKDGSSIKIECIDVEYPNAEKCGRLRILKYGQVLAGYNAKSSGRKRKGFEYKYVSIPDTSFTITAREDIYAADSEDHLLVKKGDTVVKVTTGHEKPEKITASGNGDASKLISYSLCSSDSSVTVTLPLGKYTVKEEKTPYGFLKPEKESWDIEFNDTNAEESYRNPVVLSSKNTDKDGKLTVKDDCAKAHVKIIKSDARSAARPVSGCAFGLYSADDIYNYDGQIIVKKDQLIDTVTTGADGKAVSDLELPVMSEDYRMSENYGRTDESQDNIKSEKNNKAEKANSGNYYFRELSSPDSYYINASKAAVHVEYKDDRTAVIESSSRFSNTPTEIYITKVSTETDPATFSSLKADDPLDGCSLSLSDSHGNMIASWVTGNGDSVVLSKDASKLGYSNLRQEYKNNRLHITGLLRGETYTLTETEPAEGWTTQEPVSFTVPAEEKDMEHPLILWNGEKVQCKDNLIIMNDTPVKYTFSKKKITGNDELPGCRLSVVTTEGAVVDSWISGKEEHMIKGSLIAGNTYYFREERPADGYATAETVKFTVLDEKNVQRAEMRDDSTKIHFYKTDITGEKEVEGAELSVISSGGAVIDNWTSEKEPHKIEAKLSAGESYTLRETRPADGYATASDVEFSVKDTGEIQKVTMKDDTTKIRFLKYAAGSKKLLEGASYEIKDSSGNSILRFETSDKGNDFSGILKAGEKYTFHEIKAPKGYNVTGDVSVTVQDTAKVQEVKAFDKKKKSKTVVKAKKGKRAIRKLKPESHKTAVMAAEKTAQKAEGTPKTGYGMAFMILLITVLLSGTGIFVILVKRKSMKSEK